MMDQKTFNKIISLASHRRFKQLLVMVAVLVGWYFLQPYLEPKVDVAVPAKADLIGEGNFKVVRVVDGDTFVYDKNGVDTTVRLLGVDTPETKDPRKPVQCYGKEASAETESLIGGAEVRIEGDTKADNLDKYGRELRYVYLPDGRMLNRILVTEGFAHATPQYPFSLKEEFVNLEKEADNEGKGLWSNCKNN